MESASVTCKSEEASLRSDSFVTSIKAELALTPRDLHLHETLLKRYLSIKEVDEAFHHAYNVEFRDKIFNNDLNWYTILYENLKWDSHNKNKDNLWLYQLLLLTVTERICSLKLSERVQSDTEVLECTKFLHAYDQAIHKVAWLGPSLGIEMFHTALLQHHKGQIALHSATFLLLKNRYQVRPDFRVALLMLMAWQTVPSNLKQNWLRHAPKEQVHAVNRWYIEGTYRCSQAGHYCLHLIKTLSLQSFRNDTNMKCYFYPFLFENMSGFSTSYFASGAIGPHRHIIPNQCEVEAYDKDAQKEYPHSLHHMIWTLLKYEKMADFECTLFDKLNFSTMDSEHALNKLDIYAFLYSATLAARNNGNYIGTLPANITSILCSDVQAKWWERAYEYYTLKVESKWTDMDASFTYGIKVIRCMDNKNLDPEILYNLGIIFSERAEKSTYINETHQLKERACLYYQTAMLFLQKIFHTSIQNATQYRDIAMLNYVQQVKHLLEECKMGIIKNSLTYGEYQTYYNLAHTYKRNALIFNNLKLKDKATISLFQAKAAASNALNKLLEQKANLYISFYCEIQELIQEIEMDLKKIKSNPINVCNLTNTKDSLLPLELSQKEKCKSQSILTGNLLLPGSNISSNNIITHNNLIFTFGSTPTLKPVLDNKVSEAKKPQEATNTDFSSFSFKCNTSSPTSKIFNVTPTINTNTSTNISSPNRKPQDLASQSLGTSKLNSFDTDEEYEPNIDFKPIIPLPPLIDQKTGEEDETVLFEHRAKLFRFDTASKEWKERGLGNIKLLVHKDNIQKLRLLMRREQVMKVCCNHTITKDMIFQKMHHEDKAVTWCAKDFSEGKLIAETLCLRFKTVLLCDEFIEAVKVAQTKIKDESKSTKEEENTGKQTGFSDKLKSKSGPWHCNTCDINTDKCACCETPEPKSNTQVGTITSAPTTTIVGWGDKKPKAGSWECQSCLVCNDGTLESCTACNSPKDSTPLKTSTTPTKQLDKTTKLNSGIPPTTATSTMAVKVEDIADITERDLFKSNPFEHNTVDKAVYDRSFDTVNVKPTNLIKDDRGVIFVNEIQAPQEEKQKASELMLPENFFTYKNKEPCQACRGCQNDDSKSTSSESESSKTLTTTQTTESHTISETKSASTTETSKVPSTLTTNANTLLKPLFQRPTKSMDGPFEFRTGGVSEIGPISFQNKTLESGDSLFDTLTPKTIYNVTSNTEMSEEASSVINPEEKNLEKTETTLFSVETSPSFTALSSASDSDFHQSKKIPDFKWAGGADEPILIAKKQSAPDDDKSHSDSATHVEEVTGGDEKYAPIVTLPDRVVVTTEEKDKVSQNP